MTMDGGMNIDEARRKRESVVQMAIGMEYGKKKRSVEPGISTFYS